MSCYPSDEIRYLGSLELDRRRIDYEPGRDLCDVLVYLKAVLKQRGPGLDYIHYGVREPEDRRELYGAFDLYDLDVKPLAVEIILCDVRILGGYDLMRITAVEILSLQSGESEPASSEPQIEKFIESLAVLHDRVLSDDADVAHAVLDIGDDVGGFGEHYLSTVPDRKDEPAALVPKVAAAVSGLLEDIHRLLFYSAFCKSDPDHLISSILVSPPSEPMTAILLMFLLFA